MTLEQIFDYIIVAVTSTLLFLFAIKTLALKPSLLKRAFFEIAECIGASIVFFIVNIFVGVLGIILVRGVWRFLGLYVLSGFMLVIFSLMQGFVFQIWWRRSRSGPDNFSPK